MAMLENEVTHTLKALRSHGLDVVAIRLHVIGIRPMVIFPYYWGCGPADKLATAFKAALAQLGKSTQRYAAMEPARVRGDVTAFERGDSKAQVDLSQLAAYFFRLGAIGFGGPIA